MVLRSIKYVMLGCALLGALVLSVGCGQDTPLGLSTPDPANPNAPLPADGPTPDVEALLKNLVGTPPPPGATFVPSSFDAFQTDVAVTRAPSATPNPQETVSNTLATDTPPANSANATRLPECPTPVGYQVKMPDTFPADFPIPNGASLVKYTRLNKNTNYIQLVVDAPLPLREAAVYMIGELTKRGYTFVRGDSEWNELEGIFRGKGYRGAFRISAFSECATNTLWTIVINKDSRP